MTEVFEGTALVGAQVPQRRFMRFTFANFENLPQKRGEFVSCPSLPCHGYIWNLKLYPRGCCSSNKNVTHLSLFLSRKDKQAEIIQTNVLFRTGGKTFTFRPYTWRVNGDTAGICDFEARENVLNPANRHLENGALSVVVGLEIIPGSRKVYWEPPNTVTCDILQIHESHDYSDITFAVGGETFRAHKTILAARVPGFAKTFECESNEDDEKDETIVIDDVEPSFFSCFLHYVYTGELSHEIYSVDDATELLDLLDLADKFDCNRLKLKVESEMVFASHTKESYFTEGNVLDLIVYADRKNCALLKEAAIGFFMAHSENLMQSNAFKSLDSPDLLREIMTTGLRLRDQQDRDKNDVDNMSVAAMLARLKDMGLDVDGSRETLAKRLKARILDRTNNPTMAG